MKNDKHNFSQLLISILNKSDGSWNRISKQIISTTVVYFFWSEFPLNKQLNGCVK